MLTHSLRSGGSGPRKNPLAVMTDVDSYLFLRTENTVHNFRCLLVAIQLNDIPEPECRLLKLPPTGPTKTGREGRRKLKGRK